MKTVQMGAFTILQKKWHLKKIDQTQAHIAGQQLFLDFSLCKTFTHLSYIIISLQVSKGY